MQFDIKFTGTHKPGMLRMFYSRHKAGPLAYDEPDMRQVVDMCVQANCLAWWRETILRDVQTWVVEQEDIPRLKVALKKQGLTIQPLNMESK